LKREGIIFLYRTSLGIKFINYVGTKYKKSLNVLQYFSIAMGYILMVGILFLFINSVYGYVANTDEVIRVTDGASPIALLIPYFPQLFGLESFFPPLYFTHFLIAFIAIVVVHEFAHGIFAKFHGIKIKSTGFAFLGPILGAFVEPDERQMVKKGKVAQLSILSAGTFANVIFGIIFLLILISFFNLAFVPNGFIIGGYGASQISLASITSIDSSDPNITKVKVENKTYFLTAGLKDQLTGDHERIFAFDDSPAFNANLRGTIVEIEGIEINTGEDLTMVLGNLNPGDEIKIKTMFEGVEEIKSLKLGNHPQDNSRAYLGISTSSGGRNLIYLVSPQKPSIEYETKGNRELIFFIYYLLFWLVFINFMVGLFNMLPLGILDGGRFFYLTILGITKSEKATKLIYKIMFYSIIALFALLMLSWYIATR